MAADALGIGIAKEFGKYIAILAVFMFVGIFIGGMIMMNSDLPSNKPSVKPHKVEIIKGDTTYYYRPFYIMDPK